MGRRSDKVSERVERKNAPGEGRSGEDAANRRPRGSTRNVNGGATRVGAPSVSPGGARDDVGVPEGAFPIAWETLSAIVKAGVDLDAVSADLQAEGAKSFDESWSDLLKAIETKSPALA
jgi:hypothetical protein